jgi:hypothetical protein
MPGKGQEGPVSGCERSVFGFGKILRGNSSDEPHQNGQPHTNLYRNTDILQFKKTPSPPCDRFRDSGCCFYYDLGFPDQKFTFLFNKR